MQYIYSTVVSQEVNKISTLECYNEIDKILSIPKWKIPYHIDLVIEVEINK